MPAAPGDGYRERLRLPWWWWLAGAVAAALLAMEIWMGSDGMRAWLPFVVLLPATALGLWRLGRIAIRVHDGELLVDDARLPVEFVGDAIAAGRGRPAGGARRRR